MDAIPTDAADFHYSDPPPMLLAASSDAAMARAERSVMAAGFRVGARLPIEFAGQRIEEQIATTALWVELDGDGGEPMAKLVSKVSSDVEAGRYAAVISATADLIDPLASFIETSGPELIIDADDAERAAALAIAMASRGMRLNVNDVASDNSAERLRQLSAEVSRIALAPAPRWLRTMVSQGIFVRRAGPHDGRRVFVELAPDASHALRRYFAEVGQIAVV